MGGMKVSDLDFLRLLPAFMRDDEAAIALSKAMNKLISEPASRLPRAEAGGKTGDAETRPADKTKARDEMGR